MKYIAYGSNMVEEQMAVRCPEARLIGTGYISGVGFRLLCGKSTTKTNAALIGTKVTPATTSRKNGPCT